MTMDRHAQRLALPDPDPAELEKADHISAIFAIVQWLTWVGGKCKHREEIRTVSGEAICIYCGRSPFKSATSDDARPCFATSTRRGERSSATASATPESTWRTGATCTTSRA